MGEVRHGQRRTSLVVVMRIPVQPVSLQTRSFSFGLIGLRQYLRQDRMPRLVGDRRALHTSHKRQIPRLVLRCGEAKK